MYSSTFMEVTVRVHPDAPPHALLTFESWAAETPSGDILQDVEVTDYAAQCALFGRNWRSGPPTSTPSGHVAWLDPGARVLHVYPTKRYLLAPQRLEVAAEVKEIPQMDFADSKTKRAKANQATFGMGFLNINIPGSKRNASSSLPILQNMKKPRHGAYRALPTSLPGDNGGKCAP